MKKAILLMLMLPSLLWGQASNDFTINGTFKGMLDKTELVLKSDQQDAETLLVVKSDGQRFSMTGKLSEPGMYFIQPKKGQQKLLLFLDASTIKIEGDFVKLQSFTQFKPTITLAEGLKSFFNWANQEEIKTKLTSWVRSVP
jgi:hypothetical protein